MKPRRAIGYARVSSVQQTYGASLDDQQAAMRAYAERIGVPFHKMYVEAESGGRKREEKRYQMQALLAEVRAGDLVLCDKLDRWSRDPGFTYTTIRDLLAMGAHFYSVGEQCDPSTPEGDTMLNFRILFAREEHKRIRERTVGTRNKMRTRGLYTDATPPTGYARAGGEGDAKHVLVPNQDADMVRRVFALAIAGRSLVKIAKETGRERSTLLEMLRNRHYLGEVRDGRGDWLAGRHAPLVDVGVWSQAHEALAARRLGGARERGGKTRTSTWILRNVAACAACGARSTSAWSGANNYYRCASICGANYVNVAEVEEMAGPLVLARLAELREYIARGPAAPGSGARAVDAVSKRERILLRRSRVTELFEMGDITRDELRTRMSKLDAELARVEVEDASQRPSPSLATPKARRAALKSLDMIEMAWAKATPATRRRLVDAMATKALVAAHEPPVFEWRTLDKMLTS